jgi:hypothetical protein
VAGLNLASRDLRQKRLIGHVWQRIDHDDFGFAAPQVLLELQSGVKTGVAATDNKNSAHGKSTP